MALLVLSLVLCALISLSDSACFHQLPVAGATHCIDPEDNSQHLLGSIWKSNGCMRCTCSTRGMRCCDMMGKVVNIHTEGCTVEYDYRKCSFEVFHTKDRNIKCQYGATGK
ncbi:beta-microseminoprotein-like [Paramisgurnus dabryanus]|uniref:beta-microseminoprotein-like n=1 Tax=Paramisgurnus dabryanus TaxID=90735 RepID=UPI0031F44309